MKVATHRNNRYTNHNPELISLFEIAQCILPSFTKKFTPLNGITNSYAHHETCIIQSRRNVRHGTSNTTGMYRTRAIISFNISLSPFFLRTLSGLFLITLFYSIRLSNNN